MRYVWIVKIQICNANPEFKYRGIQLDQEY